MTRTTSLSLIAGTVALIAAATILGGANAPAPDPVGPTAPTTSRAYLHSYNLPSSGIAIEGYCPVAYFAVNKPVRGKPEYASTWKGVTYHFVSADAKAAFDRAAAKFVPAFGGWCAFGMSVQDKFPIDPTCFKIVDGRLLLFLRNEGIDARALWNDGVQSELQARAEAHWMTVHK